MRVDSGRLIVWPNSGFANRLKSLVSASLLDEEYRVYWPSENFCGLSFGDIFADTWREIDHIPADSPLLNTWRFELPAELRSLLPLHFSDCSTGYKGIDFPGDSESRTIDFEYLRIPQPILMAMRARFAQLRFTPEITERVEAILERIPGPFVGVHARTWVDEPERRQKWFCFDDFARACVPFQQQNMVVSSDDPTFISSLSQALDRELITMPSGQRAPKPWQQNTRDEMLDDIAELLVLSRASDLVLTALSTYSEVAWFFGGCAANIHFADPSFQHKGHAAPQQNRDISWVEVAGNPSYFLALIQGNHAHLDHLGAGVHRIGDYFEKYSGFMKRSGPNDYMIDVGANIGLSAFPVASLKRRVVAFEPVPGNLEAMKQTVARNGFETVTLIGSAVSSHVGTTHLYVPVGRADNSSFGEEVANANVMSPHVSRLQVPTETIDHWAETEVQHFPPGDARLMKVDVQGYEMAVFTGARMFIAACRPHRKLIIEFEFDPKLTKMAGYQPVDLLNLIHSYGMEIYYHGTLIPSERYADFCSHDINADLVALFSSGGSGEGCDLPAGASETCAINEGDAMYDQDFYNSQIVGSLQSAQVFLYHLFSLWGVPGSAVDVGCGRGTWLATCLDMGVKRAVGVDGDWNSAELMIDPRIEFHRANLEKRLVLSDRFDLAISLEVAEHLQPESSDDFVESLTSLSDVVLFGAAFSGQPGVNHINTRPHSFWAEKFFSRGYVLFDLFRPVFWNDDRIEPCYRQNTFVYVKPAHPLHDALVSRGYVPDCGSLLLDCVHPAIYLGLLNEYMKLQQTLGLGVQSSPANTADSTPGTGEPLSEPSHGVGQLVEQAEDLVRQKKLDDAVDAYRLALAQEPDNPECLLRLSHVLLLMKRHGEAASHVERLIQVTTDFAFGYYLMGFICRELGRWKEARSYLLRAVELDPSHIYARVLCCMSSFTVCMDEAEALSILNGYADELGELIRCTLLETADQVNNAVDGIGALAPFFLPYLGGDVKDLQQKYGAWVCSIMAAKYPELTRPLPGRPAGGKIRIGIVSHYFHNHSNWKIPIKGWLEQLDRELFSIHCFHSGEISDTATESARSLADSFIQNSDVEALAAAIHEQCCDALIYPGIGMDTNTLKLAALRLAPVQCASWGHPVTTGMPTVDYYLSSGLMEPEDGEGHYSEKLVRLPNLSIWYDPPEAVARTSSKLILPGLAQGDIVFLCCQNLLKYLPAYDSVFPAIAAQVKAARFVFIASPVAELTDKFLYRLDLAFQSRGLRATDHVTVVPQLDEAAFSALNARADIFLDSIEWSGCNTVFESLPFNKPIVTFPGRFMRGRHAYAVLKMMGTEETIAANPEEYVAIAARLALDPQWRAEVSDRISRNKHRIYRDRECISALERFLIDCRRMLRSATTGPHPCSRGGI
ncbi:FkbM family methyltransferase [Pelotalea chapellei]|uniref:protein O-GlcNAc transferase n=1 Tax=Pelotalea chapellei TaxID=44671 RepID=A0ABS5UAM2_9BACT|nr:FkbM family methyltransferase [Pelotalea chapellei]MBT1072717.1 FkbM family methyltransferase [Pelotalea chapellei]